MPQRKSDENKLAVYIDSSSPMFSDRLIKVMNNSEIKAEKLAPPKGKLNVLGWAWRLRRSKPKIVHYLWGGHHPLIYMIPKLLGKKVIVHWIGSDVLHATSNREGTFNTLLQKIAYKTVDMHLVDFEPLANELKLLGIEAKVVPLMPDIPLLQ